MRSSQYEVVVARAVTLNSLADMGNWAPGLVPHVIRAVSLGIGNAIGGAGVVKVDKRPTFGSDTDRGDGDVAEITVANATAGGKILYADGLNVTVNPGEQVVFQCTDVTASGDVADLFLLVEPVPELPANIAAMVDAAA